MSEKLKDEALVKLARSGDGDAVSALLVRFSQLVSLRAAAFKCDLCEQEDLEQEGLIAVLSAVRSFDFTKNTAFRTYVGDCIDNRMISFIRFSSRQNRLNSGEEISEASQTQAETDPEKLLLAKESFEGIMSAVAKSLSGYEKNVLSLYIEGLSYAEMAERLGKSTKSVGNALARVRDKLYKLISHA